MARRGDALRDHILDTAKLVFLESGFERASMDAIAARAQTSKRSLYAHFPTKDELFTAAVERIRSLFAERMHSPGGYAADAADAVTRYCGRFAQLLRWSSVVRTSRLGIAEAERLPEVGRGLYTALFGDTADALADYVHERWSLPAADARAQAERLLGAVTHPEFPRLLFGVDSDVEELPDEAALDADVDLAAIRRLVDALLGAAS